MRRRLPLTKTHGIPFYFERGFDAFFPLSDFIFVPVYLMGDGDGDGDYGRVQGVTFPEDTCQGRRVVEKVGTNAMGMPFRIKVDFYHVSRSVVF